MSNDHAPDGAPVAAKKHYEKLDNHSQHGGGHIEEGEGPWLMSFADMVTLLMCFFILFFATDKGNIKLQDPEELLKKLEQLQKILSAEKTSDSNDAAKIRTPSGANGSIDFFKKDVKRISQELDLVFSVGTPQPGEIELTFLNTRFFNSGKSTLTPTAERMLQIVAQKLSEMDDEASIEVEGHTDSDPIKNVQYPSNWELSGARAATVVRLLQEFGLNPKRLAASGMAHYQPIAVERTPGGQPIPANKALNRRVVIRVKTPVPAAEKSAKPDKEAAP